MKEKQQQKTPTCWIIQGKKTWDLKKDVTFQQEIPIRITITNEQSLYVKFYRWVSALPILAGPLQ